MSSRVVPFNHHPVQPPGRPICEISKLNDVTTSGVTPPTLTCSGGIVIFFPHRSYPTPLTPCRRHVMAPGPGRACLVDDNVMHHLVRVKGPGPAGDPSGGRPRRRRRRRRRWSVHAPSLPHSSKSPNRASPCRMHRPFTSLAHSFATYRAASAETR